MNKSFSICLEGMFGKLVTILIKKNILGKKYILLSWMTISIWFLT